MRNEQIRLCEVVASKHCLFRGVKSCLLQHISQKSNISKVDPGEDEDASVEGSRIVI